MEENLLNDLTELREKCQDLVASKDREQAYTILYESLKATCQQETAAAVDVNAALATYIKDFSSRILRLVTDVKRSEDFSIQKALGKIELADEIIESLSIKKDPMGIEESINQTQETRESRGIRSIGERPMTAKEKAQRRQERLR
jgi:hypothetical protein